MSEMLLMCGYPCSGKTMFVRYLQSNRSNLLRVSMDDIYKMLDYKYRSLHSEIYKNIENGIVSALLKMNDVIIDRTLMSKKERERFIKLGQTQGTNIIVYQISESFDLCFKNNKNRDLIDERGFPLRVPDDAMANMRDNFDPPHISEGIRSIRLVKWVDSEEFEIGNTIYTKRPSISEVATAKKDSKDIIVREQSLHGTIKGRRFKDEK